MPRFELFSPSHLVTLLIIALCCVGVWNLRNRLSEQQARWGAWLVAALIAGYGVKSYWVIFSRGLFSWATALPLHICDLLAIAAVITCLWRRQTAFEAVYFWGLAGTLPTLITPNLSSPFPSWAFIQFFWLHGVVVVAIFYMIGPLRLRPRPGCLWRMFLGIQIYMVTAMAVNALTGGNYGFLSEPPLKQDNLIARLGPWPWYILWLQVIALASFVLYYLPWWIKDRKSTL